LLSTRINVISPIRDLMNKNTIFLLAKKVICYETATGGLLLFYEYRIARRDKVTAQEER